MENWTFRIVDVFTERPLAGNQLAVFADASSIPVALLQPLALEIGYAETVFVYPATAGGDARIRIFTPTSEVPFAGHPTLGTAVITADRLGKDQVVLETGHGPVPVTIQRGAGSPTRGTMQQPIPTITPFPEPEPLLAALGVARSALPVTLYDNGIPHVYVMLERPEDVAALQPDLAALARLARTNGQHIVGFNVFSGADRSWKTRMFAPADGVPEDAATGSAAGPLALHLARHGLIPWDSEIRIAQGAELGRPSELLARVSLVDHQVGAIEVSGYAVPVGGGWFDAELLTDATLFLTLEAARPFVIGTAGHVDHGKSTLVKALTGIDPDRLAEEKARAMTIDLGFAWLTLPSGRPVSVVDVPGHERFIKNMLAGVGGIDAALLVIAADDGPMPQTDEHLAILDLLGIERGIVALSKCDLVDDDWLALVQEEIRERLVPTTLASAPIVPVSALTGEGVPSLLDQMEKVLAAAPPAASRNVPRLPVDRVFSLAGFGTVVTGTLSGGEIAIGDELQIFPRARTARIRGLQNHQTKVSRALPGSRTAVNLSGVTPEQIQRGDVLAPRGLLTPTQRLDVRLHLLAAAPLTLKQNDEVDFFSGAAELPARLTLLDRERLQPGETAWVQLRFRAPLAVLKHDRFIVRRASPSATIGGGEIVDPHPPRHKRFRPETLTALETLAAGSPDEIVLQQLAHAPVALRVLRSATPGLAPDQVDEAIAQLVAEGDALMLGNSSRGASPAQFAIATSHWQYLTRQMLELLQRFHTSQPLRRGMPREETRRRLQLSPPRLFDDFIASAVNQVIVADDGATLRLPDFRLALDPARRAQADAYVAALRAAPFVPPGPHEHAIDAETLAVLEHNGEVAKVEAGVYFAPEAWTEIVTGALRYIDDHGAITMAQFRDHFGSSRKYAQAALEHLDRLKYTRRVGDDRVRGARRPDVA